MAKKGNSPFQVIDEMLDDLMEEFLPRFLDPILDALPKEEPSKLKPKGQKKKIHEKKKKKARQELIDFVWNKKMQRLTLKGGEVLMQNLHRVDNKKEIIIELSEASKKIVKSKGNFIIEAREMATMKQYLGISNASFLSYYKIVQELYQEKKYDDAEALCQLMILLNPFIFEPWLVSGILKQGNKAYEEAFYAFSMASLIDLKNPCPHILSAECYLEIGDHDNAGWSLDLAKQFYFEELDDLYKEKMKGIEYLLSKK